ncbi:hypothetical protein [Planctobacterium marinum]|uniref:hypothetical protein n=1 Tax=Planctobacterium marinum TaxID=1631968 RepID=UPI001E4CA872|nr:hypothetical protein [Planctobacterium marinum]MCC2608019.1 hypothetical protein [Planctobacterium marinum]
MRMFVMILCLLMASGNVLARQILKDPTRPANKAVLAVDEEGGAATQDGAALGSASGQGNNAAFPNAKLSAIVVTDPVKYAIINNEVVYEGAHWRNVILSQVKPYSIILKLNDLEKEITISKTDFITESNYDH